MSEAMTARKEEALQALRAYAAEQPNSEAIEKMIRENVMRREVLKARQRRACRTLLMA